MLVIVSIDTLYFRARNVRVTPSASDARIALASSIVRPVRA
jgi:hypothetical protein